MKQVLFIACVFVGVACSAQDTSSRKLTVMPNSMDHPVQPANTFWRVVYYDANWNVLKNKKGAVYYRNPVIKNGDGYELEYFRVDNTRVKTGNYLPKIVNYQLVVDEGVAVKEGHFVYYDDKGEKESEGEYLQDKKAGEWKLYKAGVLIATEVYENGIKK